MANRLISVMQLISSLEVGGAEKLLLDLLAACRDDDQVNFTVVIMNQAVNPDMRQRLERMGLNVYYLERPEGHFHLKYLWELMQIVRRHRVQVIHAHNSGSKLWAMLCKLLRPSLKLVFTIHDTVPASFSLPQRLLHRTLIDQHIAISQSVDQLCERQGFYKRQQIYNGIDLKPFENPDREPLTQRLQKQSFEMRPLHIIQVGRMHYPKKGQDLLIQAVARCKEQGLKVKATLMGGVYAYNQQSFDELRQMVGQLKLESEIEFLVNRTDVPEVLKQADLFVLPSRYEGLGLVVLEAMAAGVPVIASNIDGPAELVRHGENGLLFESNQLDSLCEQIQRIYQGPELAKRFSENALDFVKKFDIHHMKSRYFDLYGKLMCSKGAKYPISNHSDNQIEPMLGEVLNGTPV